MNNINEEMLVLRIQPEMALNSTERIPDYWLSYFSVLGVYDNRWS